MAELQKIILIHRHGARFPLKSLHADLSWPINKQFWEEYRGQLTPIGIKQLYDVGADLREFYGDFLEQIDSRSIRVHSSNSQRTMMSGWSFLLGAFPGRSFYFKYMGDKRQDRMNSVVENQVPIIIEVQARTDKLFHTGKSQRKKNHVSENLETSTLIKELAQSPEYQELCNKLHRMTGMDGFSPEHPMHERLVKFRTIHTQLAIARAHHLERLANVTEEELTDRELEMVEIVGAEIKKCSYMPGDEKIQCKPVCNNYLLNEIYRYICCTDNQFVHLSAHDTTLMELGVTLGLKIPTPDFASYFLIEVHEKVGGEVDEYELRFFFNPDPTVYSRANLVPRTWTKQDHYQDWLALPEGSMSVEQFEKQYQLNNLQRIYELVSGLSVKTEVFENLSRSEIERRYPEIAELFCYIDEDNDNHIGLSEYLTLFERLGHTGSYVEFTNRLEELGVQNDRRMSLPEFYQSVRGLGFFGMESPR